MPTDPITQKTFTIVTNAAMQYRGSIPEGQAIVQSLRHIGHKLGVLPIRAPAKPKRKGRKSK